MTLVYSSVLLSFFGDDNTYMARSWFQNVLFFSGIIPVRFVQLMLQDDLVYNIIY
jgi:hypothetical protein